jgi:hypothetical protein
MSNSPFPDKDLAREGWLDIVKPVDMVGRLDHIPARKPRTKKDKETARLQNYWLTRRSIGGSSEQYRTNYDRIKWNRHHEPSNSDATDH